MHTVCSTTARTTHRASARKDVRKFRRDENYSAQQLGNRWVKLDWGLIAIRKTRPVPDVGAVQQIWEIGETRRKPKVGRASPVGLAPKTTELRRGLRCNLGKGVARGVRKICYRSRVRPYKSFVSKAEDVETLGFESLHPLVFTTLTTEAERATDEAT